MTTNEVLNKIIQDIEEEADKKPFNEIVVYNICKRIISSYIEDGLLKDDENKNSHIMENLRRNIVKITK